MTQSSASAHGPKPKQQRNASTTRKSEWPTTGAHHAAFGVPHATQPSISDPCPHLAKGRCVRGKNCNHSHDHLSTEAIRAITCQVSYAAPKARVQSGRHELRLYHHPASTRHPPDAEPEPAECQK